MSVNGGNQTVPTLLFPDGSAATNPSIAAGPRPPRLSPVTPGECTGGLPGHRLRTVATSGQRSGISGESSGPPNQCSMIRREIEMRPDTTTDPSASAAASSSRVNHRAASISSGLEPQVGAERPGREAQHERRRERPGLVAQVGHVGDLDPDLLGHLAGDRRGERLPRLDEPREHRHPVAAEPLPARQEDAVVGVDDRHDDGHVGARVVLAAVGGAAADPAGQRRGGLGARTAGSGRGVRCQFARASVVAKADAPRSSRSAPTCRRVRHGRGRRLDGGREVVGDDARRGTVPPASPR